MKEELESWTIYNVFVRRTLTNQKDEILGKEHV